MKQNIVSAEWLNEHSTDKDLIILDASSSSNVSGLQSENAAWQIPNARIFDIKKDFTNKNSPFPNTIPEAEQFETACRKLGINNSHQIIVYDNLGIYTSPRVWWMFKVMGHENIAVLNGGMPEWIKQGFETMLKPQIPQEYDAGNFKASFQKQFVKTYQDILDNTKTNSFLLVDARSSGRFKGTAPEPRAHLKSGAIPNSVNIPYGEVLENGKFKSAETLKVIFKKQCDVGKDLAFTCGSGLTACIILLASEIAFQKSRNVYDGSWTEWAEQQNLKVN